MALGDSYLDLDALKEYLGIKLGKIDNDGNLAAAIDSTSREIERICNRQFNRAEVATPRIFAPSVARGRRIEVDDFYTTDDLLVEYDETGLGDWVEIASDYYELYPYNGVVSGLPGWPFTEVRVLPLFLARPFFLPSPALSLRRARFRVTAKWGWAAVPADIRQACMMLCGDTYQQKDSPYGVMSDQYGVTLRPSGPTSGVGTQARLKLSRYTRNRLLAA